MWWYWEKKLHLTAVLGWGKWGQFKIHVLEAKHILFHEICSD
jgi:malic enzyme